MKLSLLSSEKTDCPRLAAEGEITSRDFHDDNAKNPLESVLGLNWPANKILLDMARVTFIDSTAIGWMIDTHRKTKAAGGKLVIHSSTPRVREVFDLLRLGIVLNLRDDEASAKKLCNA